MISSPPASWDSSCSDASVSGRGLSTGPSVRPLEPYSQYMANPGNVQGSCNLSSGPVNKYCRQPRGRG
jgi:hypothetical protein